jgi:ribosomal protein S18 acetylase RimI-like enzyme
MSDAEGLVTRSYTEDDEHAVLAVWEDAFPHDGGWQDPRDMIRRKLAVQRELFLVGEWEGAIVGTVLAGYDGHRGWLYHLAVHSAHRRRGFGAALVREAERRLADLGCPKVNLQVRATNTAVVAFYRELGYAIEERLALGRRLDDPAAT